MERRNGMSLREAMALRRKQQQEEKQQAMAGGSAGGGAATGGRAGLARVYRQARASGQLNASTRGLKEFPTEILRLHELVEADEKSWECQPLTKVDLSYNEIPSVPPEITRLHLVATLKLRHNQIKELPDAFFDLETLTSLDLSNNELEGCLSESLGRLVNLRELGLEHNKLTALPESLCSLEHLEILRVEENQLLMLPQDFGNLQRLHTLGAHSNQLTALPASFARLTNLTTLDLKKNSLKTIGQAVQNLSRLRFLDLRNNKLQEFPFLPRSPPPLDQLMLGYNLLKEVDEDSLLRVKDSLTVLDLRDNKLVMLPERFAHLYRLKTLDLSNNDLHDLNPGLGYLKYLNHISIDGNPLRSIRRSAISAGTQALKKYLRTRGSPPEGVEALEQEFDEFALRDVHREEEQSGLVLDASNDASSQFEYMFRDAASNGSLQMIDMRLQTLPEQIQGAGKYRFAETLVQLNLSKNKLGQLPKAISELHALQTLTAEECALTSVDSSIATLAQLQHLRLRKNMLSAEAVDKFLEQEAGASICLSLKELDLRNNVLREMPSRLQFLVVVDTLLLSYNRLQSLEGFPWAAMRRLSVVSLADNQLESMGSVCELPLLTSLSVENNNLRQIPAELGACENLRALYIVGNPQRSVRLNIVNEGTDAILKYLKNRLPFGYESPAKAFVDTAPKLPTVRGNNQGGDSENVPPRRANVRDTSTTHQVEQQKAAQPYTSPNPAEYKRARRSLALSPGAQADLRQPSFGISNQQHPPAQLPPATSVSVAPAPRAVTAMPPPQQPTSSAPTTSAGDDAVLKGYDEKIKLLESQLDDFALSQAKKFALKKELAMVRSQKIRHVRNTSQAA